MSFGVGVRGPRKNERRKVPRKQQIPVRQRLVETGKRCCVIPFKPHLPTTFGGGLRLRLIITFGCLRRIFKSKGRTIAFIYISRWRLEECSHSLPGVSAPECKRILERLVPRSAEPPAVRGQTRGGRTRCCLMISYAARWRVCRKLEAQPDTDTISAKFRLCRLIPNLTYTATEVISANQGYGVRTWSADN